MFILWPLAIVGVIAMVAAAWRVGTVLALWILPSLGLYLLYYFAPGGETTLLYLRFFITILPAAILAALWVVERALVNIPVASVLPRRLPLIVGAGVLTALGCAVNVLNILPQLDSAFVRASTVRSVVDNLREALPRGSAIFADESVLNELDCVGGWKLYDTSLFFTGMYQFAKNMVERRGPADQQDPDPIQTVRYRFYMDLLTDRNKGAPRGTSDIRELQKDIIDQNLAAGHRVVFLTLADPADLGGTNGKRGPR